LFAVKIAVCVPVVAELFTMIAELPGRVAETLSGADPSDPDFSVRVMPVPPTLGAGTTISPVVDIFIPNALSEEVPTVDKSGI